MTDNYDMDSDDEEGMSEEDDMIYVVAPKPQPHAIGAGIHDPWPRTRSRNIGYLLSFDTASDQEKRSVVPRPRRRLDGDFYEEFRGSPCYELWTDGKLTGLAVATLSAYSSHSRGELCIYVGLSSIYLRSRQRGLGLCSLLCEAMANSLYQRILTLILRCPPEQRTSVVVEVSAELISEGGQAAIILLANDLCPQLEYIERCLGIPVKTKAITNAW